ncbi:component of oligomeric golgi complex 7 [Pyrrhoderma noxium]|uniref:Conserved oligomeric Golgi complex subunit 7 n=1 Tax=Pyrrhoderma noxium TaxID=2282107 RepID=A0A286U6J6_9AGAM|nr:component of oligomeric golgi complex 7 [Pyrrhoderma noxium]
MQSSLIEDNKDVLQTLENYPNVISWINEILNVEENEDEDKDGAQEGGSLHQDLSELEKRVSHLSAILEIACEDTSIQLENTISTLSRTVPRLTYDLQLMQENALSLKSALQAVETHSETFLNTKDMGLVLDQLNYLDTVKRNMDASLVVLREAESWSSLESEVVSFLSEQAYSKAATRLSEASKSLGVFQNTPEFETRKTLMTNLQNQLEASLSSALVAAINTNDVDACKNFFNIFRDIERESEFRSYWNGSKRKEVASMWQDIILADCGETNTEGKKKFTVFLPEFYQGLLSVLQVERLSAPLIFPDPQPTLSTFVANTLTSLHPSPSTRLNQLINYYGDLVLPELISAFKSTEEFALSTSKIMEKIGFSAFAPSNFVSSEEGAGPGSPPQQRMQLRRRSTRQSFSRRVNRSSFSGGPIPPQGLGTPSGSSTLDNSWEETLFEPFIEYQCDYTSLEKRLLRYQLKSVLSTTSVSATGARLLREGAIDVLSCADESLSRCMTFTHGYGLAGLMQALDDLFDSFLQSIRKDILEVGGGIQKSADPSRLTGITGQELIDLDLDDSDYSTEDLATVQLILHLLDAIRSVLDKISGFEAKLRSSIIQTSGALRMARADPFATYISGTTNTVLTLLQGSTLNSIELQTLLDTVDPEHPPLTQTQSLPATHSTFNTPSTPGFPSIPPIPHTLQGQRHPITGHHVQLLLGSRKAVSLFAQACQKRLQETLLSPLLKHLTSYTSLPIWRPTPDPKSDSGSSRLNTSSSSYKSSSTPDQKRGGGGQNTASNNATSEVVIPTFSLSPTPTIQRIAEGLLNLPRLFEVYADDDALAFSIETLPFVDSKSLLALASSTSTSTSTTTYTDTHVSTEPSTINPPPGVSSSFSEPVATTTTSNPNDIHPTSFTRPKPPRASSSSSSYTSHSQSQSHPHPHPQPQPQQNLHLPPEAVSTLWLSSLSLTFFSHLTTHILPSLPTSSFTASTSFTSLPTSISTSTSTSSASIPTSTSSSGSSPSYPNTNATLQLTEDLSYLSQIGRALGVEWPPLETWLRALTMDMDDLKARLTKDKHKNKNRNTNRRQNVNVGMKRDVVGSGGGNTSGGGINNGGGEGVENENEEESLDPEVLEILQNVFKFRS